MPRKILKVSALLLVGLVVAGVASFLWLRTSLPQVSGEIKLAGLTKPVTIFRDANAIPYIAAETQQDAYFALGFVHAQDRLWQMEFLRRMGAGRLAEVLGEKAVSTDRYIRTLGLPRIADAIYEKSSPDVRSILAAYTSGVNAWLSANENALPPEFVLFRYTPERWRPQDPLLWSRIMALRLGRNHGAERVRLRVSEALAENGLPATLIDNLWPRALPEEPTTVAALQGVEIPPLALPKDSGSNGWIVHGSRTDTGKPILANDPHLRFGAPVLWYLASIEAPGLRLTGATVPGVPFTILGHNGAIAWGMTNGGGDVEDLFIKTVDPDDPNRYLTPKGSRAFETRREIIQVKDSEPVEVIVRMTRHGPVLSDLRHPKGEGPIVVLATPALRDDDRTVEAILAINRARDWPAFEAAARDFHTPHTNLFFASMDGDVGLVSSGRIPIRTSGTGFMPVSAADGTQDWNGFIPMDELPRRYNPPSGLIVNANNRIVRDDYPYPIARHWGPPYRAERITELLEARKVHRVADSEVLQGDIVSTAARRLLPLMMAVKPTGPRQREALKLLSAWKYQMARNRPEPLIYATWLRHIGRALIADEVGGEKAGEFTSLINRPGARFVTFALTEGQRWCDDIKTKEKESCADILKVSLDRALDELATAHGDEMNAWRWGSVHQAIFAHPILSRVPVLPMISDLNIGSDGGDYTVNRGMTAGQRHPNPHAHTDGSGYRAVYDLSNLDNSRFMIATGQSGNLLSPYYGDMLEDWRDGKYIKIIRRGEGTRLRLEPK